MDIRKISLYLSGKIPPYEKFSRLEFYEYLENGYGYSFEKMEFYWKQAREFEEELYFLVFDKLYGMSKKDNFEKIKLDKLLNDLNIPNDICGTYKGFDYELLKKEYDDIIKIKTSKNDGKSQKKGKQFEIFLKNLISNIDGLEIIELKPADDEQIDLLIKNNINKPFWINLNSPLIIGEAKNWSDKTPSKELSVLANNITEHSNFTRIGFFISLNGFTYTTDDKMLRNGSADRIIVKIEGNDIEDLLSKKLNPIEWLEKLILKSFK